MAVSGHNPMKSFFFSFSCVSFRAFFRAFCHVGVLVTCGLVWHGLVWAPEAWSRTLRIIRDTELENALRAYMEPLRPHVDELLRGELPRFYIIPDPQPNAFVTSGNRMFIHLGLWDAAANADEMMAVISHEIGHIAGGHITQTYWEQQKLNNYALTSLAFALPLALITGEVPVFGSLALGSTDATQKVSLEMMRQRENVADQSALTLIERAGYSPYGMVTFLQKMAEREKGLGLRSTSQAAYLRTHPLSTERSARIARLYAASPLPNRGVHLDESLQELHRRAQAKARALLDLPQAGPGIDLAPGTDPGPDSDAGSVPAAAGSSPRTDIARVYGRAHELSLKRRYEQALELVETQLLTQEPDNVFFLELQGDLYVQLGQIQEAIQLYVQILEKAPWAGLVHTKLAVALLDRYDTQTPDPALLTQAEQALVRAESLGIVTRFNFVQQARLYDRQGRVGEREIARAYSAFIDRNDGLASRSLERARPHFEKDTPEFYRIDTLARLIRARREANKRG